MNNILINGFLINVNNITMVSATPKDMHTCVNPNTVNVWFVGADKPITLNIPFEELLEKVPHLKINQNS